MYAIFVKSIECLCDLQLTFVPSLSLTEDVIDDDLDDKVEHVCHSESKHPEFSKTMPVLIKVARYFQRQSI